MIAPVTLPSYDVVVPSDFGVSPVAATLPTSGTLPILIFLSDYFEVHNLLLTHLRFKIKKCYGL